MDDQPVQSVPPVRIPRGYVHTPTAGIDDRRKPFIAGPLKRRHPKGPTVRGVEQALFGQEDLALVISHQVNAQL